MRLGSTPVYPKAQIYIYVPNTGIENVLSKKDLILSEVVNNTYMLYSRE